jgi:acyl-CoA hydrolase
VKLDVALLQLSPPDAHGFCSLGTSCLAAKAAAETARLVVAEINEQMPRTHGNNVMPLDRLHAFVATNRPLFIHDNPLVHFFPCDWTNDTHVIRKNPRVVAINSAIQIDLTGQVCADSIGHRVFSGIGGQMDFMRGAALSRGGRPIIALPATAAGGKFSRLVVELNPGAVVVTTRGHVHWVVTEYGAVNLHGKSLRERGAALISIAHPDFRAELTRDLARARTFPAK